jgi:hypothetical protein
MGDMAEFFNDWKAHKKERRQRLGMPCPDCTTRLPKAQPKILMPNQKCWCGYIDKRPREAKIKEKNNG